MDKVEGSCSLLISIVLMYVELILYFIRALENRIERNIYRSTFVFFGLILHLLVLFPVYDVFHGGFNFTTDAVLDFFDECR